MKFDHRTIKKFREEIGLSVSELAEAAGLPISTVMRIESGEREPGVAVLAKLADGLEIDDLNLFFFTGGKSLSDRQESEILEVSVKFVLKQLRLDEDLFGRVSNLNTWIVSLLEWQDIIGETLDEFGFEADESHLKSLAKRAKSICESRIREIRRWIAEIEKKFL